MPNQSRYLLAFAALACSACAGPRNDATVNPASFGAPDAPMPVVSRGTYRLNAFDRFKVQVFGADELSGDYIVEPSGIATFPLIGTVEVAGLTSTELAAMLEARYARRYLRDPKISVQLQQFTSQMVTVEGSVNTPVVFEMIGETNLVTAVARAGGPTDLANTRRVVVLRKINGVQNAAAFDLARIREGLDPNPVIYGGDIVIMDGSELKAAYREIVSVVPLIAIFRPFGN
ncbi:MAG: polysaccharide biosynthesis/export family protein [Blastomonas sp.]